MESWLLKTAWPMTPPKPYSVFHILFAAGGILAALSCAWALRGRKEASVYKILFLCGCTLAFSEVYKQLFLYVINGRRYDWWYFPFQLCSMPMYLCLLLPFLRGTFLEQPLLTFTRDFGLLGGIMALLEPSGLFHPYWVLTLHGLFWHIMLIFLGLFLTFSRLTKKGMTGYLRTLPLLGIFCIAATFINTATHGQADMFYIAPYYPVTQVVFDKISVLCGNGTGIMIYLLSICAGGAICHIMLDHLSDRTAHRQNNGGYTHD